MWKKVTKSEGIALGFREFEQGTVSFFGYNQGRSRRTQAWHHPRNRRWCRRWQAGVAEPNHRSVRIWRASRSLDRHFRCVQRWQRDRFDCQGWQLQRFGAHRPPGVDAGLIAVALRGRGIFLRGRYHSSSGCCRYRGLKIHKEIPRERLWWGRIELSHQSFFTMLCLVMSCPFTPGHVEPTGLAMRIYASLDRACI